MATIAFATIVVGKEDGSQRIINPGDTVSTTDLHAETIKQYKEQGLIGPEPVAASEAVNEIEELKAKLAAAEVELAEAKKQFTVKK